LWSHHCHQLGHVESSTQGALAYFTLLLLLLLLRPLFCCAVVGKTFSNIGFSTPACSWCSRSKSVLVMQDDGNLVLYGGSTFLLRQFVVRVDGRILWQTGVPGKKRN
jgi:hypothetical protein